MIRLILPVTICLATQVNAQPPEVCESQLYSDENCVRVLACIGDEGLYFDGGALGWDTGSVVGAISDWVTCSGEWTNDGPMGTGVAQLTCSDGNEIDVIYYRQDPETGTAIGRGTDAYGRTIQVWSGENVLEFLTPEGEVDASLPCVSGPLFIS